MLTFGATLVAGSVRRPWQASRAAAGLTGRLAQTAAAAPASLVRTAATAVEHQAGARRVWAAGGRAQIEVYGLAGEDALAVAAAVEAELASVGGVSWASVNLVTRRVTVRFDELELAVEDLTAAVARAEQTVGVTANRYPADRPTYPGDSQPVAQQALALAADIAGLSAALAGRLARLPSLPGSTVAAVVLIDNQPRLRHLLETRLGPAGTDLALAATNAAVQGLTQGVPSLIVDTGSRAQALLAARTRLSTFASRESELTGPHRPVPSRPVAVAERPVPLPPGPVERLADRAAAGSLLAAGGLLATGRLDLAGLAVQIGAPRAARTAREAFADTLGYRLARRGAVVVDEASLRRLDRVNVIVVDSSVLLGEWPLVLDATALVGHWTREHVWSAAQRLLWHGVHDLPLPPPQGRRRHRLALLPAQDPRAGLSTRVLTEDGRPVGEVAVGREPDPYADAVLSAARAAGLRVVLTGPVSPGGFAGQVDELSAPGTSMVGEVRRLQQAGHVVAAVGDDETALAAADVGIGLVPLTGRVPWAADVLLGPGLQELPRLLAAVPAARSVSQRGVTLALGATFLGTLVTAVGGRRVGGRAVLPVTAAAGSALLTGTLAALQVDRLPPPEPVLHTPWHALEPDEVLARLPQPPAVEPSVARKGVAASRVAGLPIRPVLHGIGGIASNVRAELADPLTPVLATGAAASAVIGSPTDALLVGGVLAANAVISGTQRWRADRALRELLAGQQISAQVIERSMAGGDETSDAKDGVARRLARQMPASLLRPGQVIELQAGDVVPADVRILSEAGLEVDEASLTGESVAVPKQVQATPGAELADRACVAYEGTTVLAGSGTAIVVAVGAGSEAGRALALAGGSSGPAGMQARLEELTRRGLPITLLGGAAVTGLALLRLQRPAAAIASGVSVAVAAVPEGLPLVATVAQLGAARRLSHRGILVRSARTVEALGRVDTVCFDKTGTLTEGRLRLARVAGLDDDWAPADPQSRRVLLAAARACPRPAGSQLAVHATDLAVLDGAADVFGEDLHSGWQELAEVPFHSERGYSAAVGRTRSSVRLVVKGAPEVLLARCSHERDDSGKRPLDADGRVRAAAVVHRLAAQGLRVLAVARRNVADDVPDGSEPADVEELAGDLTLLGFIALADIARPEAAATIAGLQGAGLSTVMITGDHPVTARAIATDLGIPAARVVTGPELAAADEQTRGELVLAASVFARVSPEQKLRIIAALQAAGRVVAMTGDGANDAAAIRLADVGIGMSNRGSSSARTAADLVLVEPDVSSLLDALVEGRAMWRRVRDAVAILIGGNAGEVAFTLVGTALAGRAPLGTRQFLLVNMLTDLLPAMAIALAPTPADPGERARLLAAGRPSLGRPLLRDIGVRGAATSVGALGAWQVGRMSGTRRRSSTMALAALVGTQLGQTLVVGGRDPLVIATSLGSSAVLAGIIQTPGVSHFFGCTPLDPVAWTVVVGCSASATAASVILPRLLTRHHKPTQLIASRP